MYKIFYRCENSQNVQKYTNERYTTINAYMDCKTKKEAVGLAKTMNTYIKKFHTEHFGKHVYFVVKGV